MEELSVKMSCLQKKTSVIIIKVINSYLLFCIFYDNVSAIRRIRTGITPYVMIRYHAGTVCNDILAKMSLPRKMKIHSVLGITK